MIVRHAGHIDPSVPTHREPTNRPGPLPGAGILIAKPRDAKDFNYSRPVYSAIGAGLWIAV
jgi:hypothetical protein